MSHLGILAFEKLSSIRRSYVQKDVHVTVRYKNGLLLVMTKEMFEGQL